MDKKTYTKPRITFMAPVEDVTRFTPAHDVFGGGFLSPACKAKARSHGAADFGS